MHRHHTRPVPALTRVAVAALIIVAASGSDARTQATESPDERARRTEQQMTDAERFAMLYSLLPIGFPDFKRDPRVPDNVPHGAAYVPGIPRLGVPYMAMTDGTMGVTSSNRLDDPSTTLPAGVSLGATFNLALARQHGAIVAREARMRGFNVLLGGGINLIRDPRSGRNFEYVSEDPLLSGLIGGERVIGTQSEGVIGTIKHISMNDSESNKWWLAARIEPAAHRESDLLAFQIAIERGEPGTLMCAYNKVNGAYACGNDPILNGVVKQAWGYKGWIHSDWKAVNAWEWALYGLDQHSGAQMDEKEWFNEPLQDAIKQGKVPRERVSDMVRRMLRSYYAVGIDKWGPTPKVDLESHGQVALETARQGIVLMKNDGLLPLTNGKQRIAVIGAHAHLGVPSGAGSSQGTPKVGRALRIPYGGEGWLAGVRNAVYYGSSPLRELRARLKDATITYDPGLYPAYAAILARRSDIVLVFVDRLESEGFDVPDLSLPQGQDALVEAVVAANPNTIVVMETGSPAAMPWRDKVKAIVQAWFPGQAGGQAIAEVLTGEVNPSGRLPMTFPADLAQLPHPKLPGLDTPFGTPTVWEFTEGADVGYRWFAKTGARPAFAFGHGLSYTTFAHRDFTAASNGETVTATVTVTNTGTREGADVPQLYLIEAAGEKRQRLLAFDRVTLRPGESKQVTLTADPRLLGRFDIKSGRWLIAAGSHRIALGRSALDLVSQSDVALTARAFGR